MAQPWMADAGEDNANIEKFLKGMGDYKAPIPDTVITHILAEAGLSTSDPRVHRTLNVACQKFIFDVITDCSTCAELRIKRTKGKAKKEKDLLVSDLKTALEAKGMHVHRPDFIVSIPRSDHE